MTPAGAFATRAWGAQVTQWDAPGHGPMLYVSSAANHTPGTALRGGIPLCFPWFGKGPDALLTPSHGFARLSEWNLVDTVESPTGDVTVTFELTPTQASATDGIQLFPHPFHATYTAAFTAESLELTLTVVNQGDSDFTFEEALHTYFAVSDVTETTVLGLEDEPYTEHGTNHTQEGSVTFAGEVDRVYSSMRAVTITDPGGNKTVTVTKSGSRSTVVWNPGQELASTMPDIGDGEWNRFVCVESGNIGPNAVTLKPQQGHSLSVRYTVSPIEPITV